MQRAQLALLFVFLVCLPIAIRQTHKPNLADFYVYDAAAELVHEHQSAHLYDDADTGADFGLRFVNPETTLGQAARRVGIDRVRLYIYPPILADLLLPFAFFSASTAGRLWLLVNYASLLATAFLMMRVLKVRLVSWGGLALIAGVLLMFPIIFAVYWGQITVLLLLLWMSGIYFYQRGWIAASAFVLALATVIKLTPLLVILPFLVWREWKWLGAFTAWVILLIAAICLVNQPSSLTHYVFHVMPSMSAGGTPDFENKSLVSSAQLLYVSLKGGNARLVEMAVPRAVGTVAKACSLLILSVAFVCLLRQRRPISLQDKLVIIAAFALLSACVAPISWKHAFVVAYLVLALLWGEALRRRVSSTHLVLLTLCSIEMGSFVLDAIAAKATHGVLLGALSFLATGTGLVLVFWRLLDTGRSRVGVEGIS